MTLKEFLAELTLSNRWEDKYMSESLLKVGSRVKWMSGGTWEGIVQEIKPFFSTVSYKIKHDVLVLAYGESFWLKGVEDYGLSSQEEN